jgi:hypothetical protein
MSASQEILASAITQDPTKLIVAIPALVIGIGAASKACTIVHQGEMGVRFRRGMPLLQPEYEDLLQANMSLLLSEEEREALTREKRDDMIQAMRAELSPEQLEAGIYRTEGQGVKWFFPGIGNVLKISVAANTSALSTSQNPILVETRDKKQYVSENARATWHVSRDGDNPYKALVKLNNEKDNKDKDKLKELTETVVSICMRGLSRVLGDMESEKLEVYHDEATEVITNQVREKCQDELGEYGVNLRSVWLPQVVRAGEQILKEGLIGGRDPMGAGMAAGYAAAKTREDNVVSIVPSPDAAA